MEYKIGTRGSALALVQTEAVCAALKARFPEHSFEIVVVKTTGDKIRNIPMREVGATGIFTRELEEQLRSGAVDLAIHSMKDMPASLPEGMSLSNALTRQDPRDVLITPNGKTLAELPVGATVGTGSLRRKYQLLMQRPDLNIVDIRGNIDTRIRKMEENGMDGIVLAAAALNRLSISAKVSQYFAPEEMLPAPTQGVLGAEYRTERQDVADMLAAIRNEADMAPVETERQFLRIMQVGCHMPVAAFCENTEKGLRFRVMYGEEDGSNIRFAEAEGTDPAAVALSAARSLGFEKK